MEQNKFSDDADELCHIYNAVTSTDVNQFISRLENSTRNEFTRSNFQNKINGVVNGIIVAAAV